MLEVMRQPLEEETVCIARASMSLTFPARFMLATAMNPCPCGFHNDRTRECHCTPPMIQRYISKISGPLMDRIDIHIDVPAVNYKEMRSRSVPEGSAQIRERVVRARQTQLNRFADAKQKTYCNAQMTSGQIRAHCELSHDCERLLERAMTQQGLSARAHDRILKVARTIADLESVSAIEPKHIAEAIQYRTLDRTYWASAKSHVWANETLQIAISFRFPNQEWSVLGGLSRPSFGRKLDLLQGVDGYRSARPNLLNPHHGAVHDTSELGAVHPLAVFAQLPFRLFWGEP